MVPKLGAERSNGIILYQRYLLAPSTAEVDAIKYQYGSMQRQYLSSFKDREIY